MGHLLLAESSISPPSKKKPAPHWKSVLSGGSFVKSGNQIFPSANIGYKLKTEFIFSTGGSYQQVNGIDANHRHSHQSACFQTPWQRQLDKKMWWTWTRFYIKKTDVSFGFKHLHMNTDIDKSAFVDDDNYTLNYERNTAYGKVRYVANDKLDILLTWFHKKKMSVMLITIRPR